MVIPAHNNARTRGSLMIELAIGTAILLGTLLPIAYSLASEKRLARMYYDRAVAMEIVDGEMEVIAAGGWRAFGTGAQNYSVHAVAATNLPQGQFTLTIQTNKIRLEWKPAMKHYGGPVAREVEFK